MNHLLKNGSVLGNDTSHFFSFRLAQYKRFVTYVHIPICKRCAIHFNVTVVSSPNHLSIRATAGVTIFNFELSLTPCARRPGK